MRRGVFLFCIVVGVAFFCCCFVFGGEVFLKT